MVWGALGAAIGVCGCGSPNGFLAQASSDASAEPDSIATQTHRDAPVQSGVLGQSAAFVKPRAPQPMQIQQLAVADNFHPRVQNLNMDAITLLPTWNTSMTEPFHPAPSGDSAPQAAQSALPDSQTPECCERFVPPP